MKFIKLLFRLMLILLVPFVIQFTTSVIFAIVYAVQAAVAGVDPAMMEQGLQLKIMEKLDVIVMIGGVFTILAFYLSHVVKKKSMLKDYRFNSIHSCQVKYVLILPLLGYLFSIGFSGLVNLAEMDVATAETLNNLVLNGSLFMTLISVGVVVPFCEEVVFRGSILKNLTSNISLKWAVVIQALCFSLYHMNIVQAVPTFMLGLLAGIAVVYTNSIWSAVIIHIVNNSLAVITSHLLPPTFMIPSWGNLALMLVSLSAILLILKQFKQEKVEWPSLGDDEPEEALVVSEA